MKYFFAILTPCLHFSFPHEVAKCMKKILIVAIIFILSSCTTTKRPTIDLVAAFEHSIYEEAEDAKETDGSPQPDTIHRWEQDIIYYVKIDDGVYGANTGIINRKIKKMDGLLPVNFSRPVKDASEINLVIWFEDRSEFKIETDSKTLCQAGYNVNEQGQIIMASIRLPGRDLAAAYKCFDHELMHAIGFSSHVKNIRSTLTSSMNHPNFEEHLTPADKALINILYSNQLHAGMSRDEANNSLNILANSQTPSIPN